MKILIKRTNLLFDLTYMDYANFFNKKDKMQFEFKYRDLYDTFTIYIFIIEKKYLNINTKLIKKSSQYYISNLKRKKRNYVLSFSCMIFFFDILYVRFTVYV